jgi:hypothetical protein
MGNLLRKIVFLLRDYSGGCLVEPIDRHNQYTFYRCHFHLRTFDPYFSRLNNTYLCDIGEKAYFLRKKYEQKT